MPKIKIVLDEKDMAKLNNGDLIEIPNNHRITCSSIIVQSQKTEITDDWDILDKGCEFCLGKRCINVSAGGACYSVEISNFYGEINNCPMCGRSL